MARMRHLIFGLCVVVAITSVQSKLTMHQQHLKMHQEMLKKKQQAAGTAATKTEGEGGVTPKPVRDAAPSPSKLQAASGKTIGDSPPKGPPETNQLPEAKTPDRESPPLKSEKEPQKDEDTFSKRNPVSEGADRAEQQEATVVPDDDVLFIDKEVENDEKDARRYPDPDLDSEDGGIGDPEGRGAAEEEEEEEEEEDYHPDDYFDTRQQEEAGDKARPQKDEEMVRPLVYKDFEDILYEKKFNMLHFVSAGCEKCETFRPHFLEAARKFWQVEEDSTETVVVHFYEVTDPQLLIRFNLRWLPTVFFFRDGVPIIYEGDLNADALVSWAFANLEVRGWSLTDKNFDKETEETKDPNSTMQWLIHFCHVDAVGCDGFMATWEGAASRLKGEIEFGYVDVVTEAGLVKRFNVDPKNLPAVVLLKKGQAYWCTLPLLELTTDNLVHFAKEGHLRIEKDEVPDKLSNLATVFVLASSNIKGIGITMVVASLLISVIYICVCRQRQVKDVGNKKAV